MKKFVVERNLPGAGNLSPEELQFISQSFCDIAESMGKSYQWIQSFITDDKIYCIHIAESESMVREHARMGKFPINTINEVRFDIDPLTANSL